ncbi:MmcQ/YjbR family DNA-binding protein [Methylobacterium aerolatum]|nr:MmcQ/YjbR family DNA-binding protein [Methylobacterium aerolatum]
MMVNEARALAELLPATVVGAHRGNPDFRVGGRVLATLWTEEERLVLRLNPEDQARFCDAEPDLFMPLDGAWGRRGWTNLDLMVCDEEILRAALLAAWRTTAPPDLVTAYEGRLA